MKTTLDQIRTIDLHINGAMVVRTLRDTSVVMRDGVLRTRADCEKSEVAEFDADREDMLVDLADAEQQVLDAAADEVATILGASPDESLDYRTLAPCSEALGKMLAGYEAYNDGCNWSLGIGRMLPALELVVRRAAAALRPVEAAFSCAIEDVNSRCPREREICVRSLQHATQKAAAAFTASSLSRVQVALDRAEYQMMRETARILGIDAGEEWISKMESQAGLQKRTDQ